MRMSELHSFQAEDEDVAVQDQADYFHLAVFHSSSHFFKVLCFLGSRVTFHGNFQRAAHEWLLVTLLTLTRVAPEFLMILGPVVVP